MQVTQPLIGITASAQTLAGLKTFSTGIVNSAAGLTAGTLTVGANGYVNDTISKFSWTNAMVAALSGTTGNLLVCTLPAKTIVKQAWIILTAQAGTLTGLTVSLGKTATAYIDYLIASSAKAAVNTIYGDAIGEVGAGLSAILGSIGSLTTTTDVNLQFISAIENLSTVTTCAGDVYLLTTTLP